MSEDSIKYHIQKYGWRLQYVFDADGVKESFAYTIGFEETLKHLEIMIFGLGRETMHLLLQAIAEDIREGQYFKPGQRYSGILNGGFDVLFKPLKNNFFREYAGAACDYYNRKFRMYVMFWPDRHNILPIEPGCQVKVQDEALGIV